VSTYLVPFNFCDGGFFVGTCRLDSEPLQIFISRPGPGKLGRGKVRRVMSMGMDAESE